MTGSRAAAAAAAGPGFGDADAAQVRTAGRAGPGAPSAPCPAPSRGSARLPFAVSTAAQLADDLLGEKFSRMSPDLLARAGAHL